jgi:hypothetical protein
VTDLAPDFCPYVGLQPFRVKDREYFFGREREQRVISANLFASPLTVLYGPSAVGKSSVLQAGVVPYLQREPRTAVVYFPTWQGDAFKRDLIAVCRRAVEAAHGSAITVDDAAPLDEWLAAAAAELHGTILVMFDQFEEYLLYHREEDDRSFDAEIARTVNRTDVSAHLLIGLRDDSLSKLNRFSKRIPNLLGNTLQLRRLTPEAARRAIVGPVERYNGQPGARPTRVEDALVDAVIADVQIGRVVPGASGGVAGIHASEDAGLVETAFLQLVLTELWRAASERAGDRVLDAATLETLGGADAIVRRHVDREMGKLSEDGREVAARLFQHLVTPSGAKYAIVTADLVDLAERPREAVLPVLQALAEARLLRHLDSSDRYEIFHDAFAAALLDWRKDYLQARAQQAALVAAEARRNAERAADRRRLRRRVIVAAAALVLALVALYFIEEQRDRAALARDNQRLAYALQIAQANEQKADQTSAAARAAQAQAEAAERQARAEVESERLALEADRARLKGDMTAAAALVKRQQATRATAAEAKAEVERLGAESKASLTAANETQARIDAIAAEARDRGYGETLPGSYAAPAAASGSYGAPKAAPAETAPAAGSKVPPGDFRETYRQAMAAVDGQHWQDAATLLRTAIAQHGSDTGERINLSGFGNVAPYIPHYYLGLALKNLGNCQAAVEEFNRSEKDGAIRKTRLFQSLVDARKACGPS